MIIAIDGLAINAKSTLASMLANKYNLKNFNTGSIYRIITLSIINNNIDISDLDSYKDYLSNLDIRFEADKVYLNNIDVSYRIREEDISVKSTEIATFPIIKSIVRNIQKNFIEKYDTVIEGRDICTRIAPNADFKFYIYSDFETRVKRLSLVKPNIDINVLREDLKKRDDIDINRGNFVKPTNAYEIDSTNLTIEEIFNIMVKVIESN